MQDTKINDIIKTYIKNLKQIDAKDDDMILSLIDSIEFLELVLFLEEKLGYEIDLSDNDPHEFSTVEKLAKVLSEK